MWGALNSPLLHEGAASQGMWAACGNCKRKERASSYTEPAERNTACQHLDFGSVTHVRPLTYRAVIQYIRVKPVWGNLLQQQEKLTTWCCNIGILLMWSPLFSLQVLVVLTVLCWAEEMEWWIRQTHVCLPAKRSSGEAGGSQEGLRMVWGREEGEWQQEGYRRGPEQGSVWYPPFHQPRACHTDFP